MKISSLLESMLFSELHNVKIDPDRADVGDLMDKLLPLLVKIAYKNLHSEKEQHERKHGPKSDDEDAYNFDFSVDALVEKVDELSDQLADELKYLKTAEVKDTIKALSKDLKEPLKDKK